VLYNKLFIGRIKNFFAGVLTTRANEPEEVWKMLLSRSLQTPWPLKTTTRFEAAFGSLMIFRRGYLVKYVGGYWPKMHQQASVEICDPFVSAVVYDPSKRGIIYIRVERASPS
jgi:hypothetical protein